MTISERMMPQGAVRPATWRGDAMLGLAGALLAFCLHALAGFPTLAAANGDNDSLLRLVEIRDLIGGEGRFELRPHPLGPARAVPASRAGPREGRHPGVTPVLTPPHGEPA